MRVRPTEDSAHERGAVACLPSNDGWLWERRTRSAPALLAHDGRSASKGACAQWRQVSRLDTDCRGTLAKPRYRGLAQARCTKSGRRLPTRRLPRAAAPASCGDRSWVIQLAPVIFARDDCAEMPPVRLGPVRVSFPLSSCSL